MRLDDLGGGDDVLHPPAVGRAHVHVLDEPHDKPLARAKRARSTRPWSLTPALDDRVELDRRQAGVARRRRCPPAPAPRARPCRSSPRNTSSSSESRLTVTRCSPASRSARALAASSVPLVVSARSLIPLDRGQHGDQPFQVPAHQWLAAGEPHLGHAQGGRTAPTTRLISSNDSSSRAGQERRGRGRTPRVACSTCSGSCSGRSPRPAGHGAVVRECRGWRPSLMTG